MKKVFVMIIVIPVLAFSLFAITYNFVFSWGIRHWRDGMKTQPQVEIKK